ncbi:MAG: complex I subunit 5 family protein [Candidatus Omnitrophota bacterium]
MPVFLLTGLPILAGIICFCVANGTLRRNLAQSIFFISLAASVFLLMKPQPGMAINLLPDYNIILAINKLSGFIIIFVNLFGLLICQYCRDYERLKDSRLYFSCLLWLIAFSNLICLAADFAVFIFAWGAGLALLYALLSMGSREVANKALVVVGLGDFFLLLGASLYIYLTGTTAIPLKAAVPLDNPLGWMSFLFMLFGAFAKSGCFPFHTWIPDAAETAPVPVMALLPACLDKLLGIYFLARVCADLFIFNNAASAFLLIIGSFTILFAVMMALVQHDLRKLLSFHAISQVGYMVLGFGTALPIGIAGALFHMLNNAIYKTGLFLTGGSVGQKKGTFELDNLGGLAKYMPVTFGAALVFSLSISGIPPLNGFASKWMIYQAALLGAVNSSSLLLRPVFMLALISAMFGSILTLASFVKFIHAIFLGEEKSSSRDSAAGISFNMQVPVVILAGLCVFFGLFPNLFLKWVIQPWIGEEILFSGSWNSTLAFILIALGLLLGLIFFSLTKDRKSLRPMVSFIGGEDPDLATAFSSSGFYKTIEEMPLAKKAYRLIKIEAFDLFNVIDSAMKLCGYLLFIFADRFINLITHATGYAVLGVSRLLRLFHTGVLDFYLAWSLFGLATLFFILMSK